jgi:hypothetical protein
VHLTVSLYQDVVKRLRREIQCSRASFKSVVRHCLRFGFMASAQKERKPFVVHPCPLGLADIAESCQ